jgi:type IV pilus assembly protein PilY1
VVDLITGGLIWKHTNLEDPDMAGCVPSDIVALDTNDRGFIDRLYVGDTGGQMWRFDIGSSDPTNWTGRVIFDCNPVGDEGRKVFYPPDVVFEEGYEMLFWGTGDRAHPKGTGVTNRVYALKDRDSLTPLSETDLVDVTDDLLQDPLASEETKVNIRTQLSSGNGWYIRLEDRLGEKVLAPAITYFGTVYLTAFTPTQGDELDPCYVGTGTARLYALDYKTGEAVLNFDTTNDAGEDTVLRKSDRLRQIGTAIPSGMVIALIRGMGSSYIGVGGGIVSSDLAYSKAILRIYWRDLF